jgi:hypothetical protein
MAAKCTKFKVGDRIWYKDTYFNPHRSARGTVIGFDPKWNSSVTIRLDKTTGSITTYPEVVTPLSALDLLAESIG